MSVPPSAMREPAFNIPPVVAALTLGLIAIHSVRELLSEGTDWQLLTQLAFVPARLTLFFSPERLSEMLQALPRAQSWPDMASLPVTLRNLVDGAGPALWSPITYGLLHGSWAHLITNVLWLVAFGSPVARRIGGVGFLGLLSAATLGGALAHWLVDPLAISPLIGASAGISGATAAAARFVFAPGVRYGDLGSDIRVKTIPAETFLRLLANPRAFAFIAFWFASNVLFGVGVVALGGEEVSIAWQAHIGGFLTGLLLFPLLDRRIDG